MKPIKLMLTVSAALAAAFITACFAAPDDSGDEEDGSGTSNIEASDPLEGAYIKQGGTPVHFIFKRDDSATGGTYLGEIEVNGKPQRASGTITAGRDSLGTTFTMVMEGAPKTRDAGKPATAALPDAGPPQDSRSIVQQAFSGTVHYLKMGKNETILVRGDVNGKTAHYKKTSSWCATADDCSPDVQKTSLDCSADSMTCTGKGVCACSN
jgi:hypothetical protein